MPTAAFSTEARRTLQEVAVLVAFRWATVRGRSRARVEWVTAFLAAVTVAAVVIPAYADGAGSASAHDEWAGLLAGAFTAFLLMAAGASVATGGGRELVARERAVAYPIGPATDHLGALLMAPLNIAWILQAWALLGLTSYVAGPAGLVSGTPIVLAWLALSTALGQVAGWSIEVVRRGQRGVLLSRAILAFLAVVGAVLVATGVLGRVLESGPGAVLMAQAVDPGWGWFLLLALLVLTTVAAVVAGIPPARAAVRRPPREEQRLESNRYALRPYATGDADTWADLRLLLRIDRASVFRSVPLRRGLLVLALVPGLGGLAAGMRWTDLVLFPGLVASGVVLLFGINAWSLDGHGILWRESLPMSPRLAFAARAVVLAQLSVLAVGLSAAIPALRAGLPSVAEAVAFGCAAVVVVLQVVAAAARWSVQHPYAVDLRSARAVPAPPLAMVGYSGRLAVSTTFTGLAFAGLAQADAPVVALVLAAVCLVWSGWRLLCAARAWDRVDRRMRVVTTLAG